VSSLLKGIRVLEFGQLLNPASLGMYLADLGADVIKVESPFLGDYMRDVGFLVKPGVAILHLQASKNKRSVSIDLRDPDGRDTFWRLLESSDVFIEGAVAGAADRLGIGYEHKKLHKPDIVFCHFSGFGGTGPYAQVPTHGLMMGALVGQMPYERGPDGLVHPFEPEEPGTERGGDASAAGAVNAALGVAAALVQRERTGEGAFIDVASSDGVMAQAWFVLSAHLNREIVNARVVPPRKGGELTGARYSCYETRDGHIALLCAIEPKFWRKFCAAIERPELEVQGDGTDFLDYGSSQSLRHELTEIFLERDLEEWMRIASEHDIPLGPASKTIEEVVANEHVRARGLIVEAQERDAGPFTYVTSAIHVEGQSNAVRLPAPHLGEHTREVLHSLGIDDAELLRMEADGVIGFERMVPNDNAGS